MLRRKHGNPHLDKTCNCNVDAMLGTQRFLHDMMGMTVEDWDNASQADLDFMRTEISKPTVEQTLDVMLGGTIPKPDLGTGPRIHEITLNMRGGVLPHRDIVPLNRYSEAPIPHVASLPNPDAGTTTLEDPVLDASPGQTRTVTRHYSLAGEEHLRFGRDIFDAKPQTSGSDLKQLFSRLNDAASDCNVQLGVTATDKSGKPYVLEHPSETGMHIHELADERLALWQHEIGLALELDSVNKEQTAKPCGDAEHQQKDFIMKNALEFIAYARANKKTVGIAAGVVSVVALVVYGVLAYRRNSEEA